MTDFDRPQDCPPTTLAADGSTVLHRFRVEAVIYAPTREDVERRLQSADIYLDAACVIESEQPARSSERARFLGDIISTAVEGGTGYWSQVSQYQYEFDGEILTCIGDRTGDEPRAVLHVIKKDESGYEDKCKVVTLDVVARGIRIIKRGDVGVRDDIKKSILLADAEDDASEIDTDAADVIVQAGLFGSIVYG